MPTYLMTCKKCEKDQDVFAWISEYEAGLKCDCGSVLTTRQITAPALRGAEPSDWKHKKVEAPRVPINIINERPDGTSEVIRYGHKTDL